MNQQQQREQKLARIAEQVERVQVTLGAPRDEGQRKLQAAELTEALEMFLTSDIENGITNLIRGWSSTRWPKPFDVINAVREARSQRNAARPIEEQPRLDPDAVCRCGAKARSALLSRIDHTTGEEKIYYRLIAPCNERFHIARKEGWIPKPANFVAWPEEYLDNNRAAAAATQGV